IEPADYAARFPEWVDAISSAWRLWRGEGTRATDDEVPVTEPGVASPPLPDFPSPLGLPGYEAVEVVGEGGMGVVYRARGVGLNRLVAIKRIQADDPNPEWLRRFRNEATALARLSHPHVVSVFAWEEFCGRPYLIMEYVAGGSLQERLGHAPLSPVE